MVSMISSDRKLSDDRVLSEPCARRDARTGRRCVGEEAVLPEDRLIEPQRRRPPCDDRVDAQARLESDPHARFGEAEVVVGVRRLLRVDQLAKRSPPMLIAATARWSNHRKQVRVIGEKRRAELARGERPAFADDGMAYVEPRAVRCVQVGVLVQDRIQALARHGLATLAAARPYEASWRLSIKRPDFEPD